MRKTKLIPVLLSAMLLVSAIPAYAAPDSEEYVYGTVNLSYADFYYGEINETSANPVMDLKAEDKTSTAAGSMYGYDAVSSCTNTKSKRYSLTYFEDGADNSVQIYGMKDVSVAVPKSLYEDALKAIAAQEECRNDLLDIVANMTVTKEVPSSYKILNGDGTLGKMTGVSTVTAEGATASISTDGRWGNYQISVSWLDSEGKTLLPAGQDLLGAVIETSDGSRYGLEHLENLWLQAAEIAFAIEDGFVEPHGNTVQNKRFIDIVGKTITSITYMYADQNIQINDLNLLVKTLVSDDCGAKATDGVYNEAGKNSKIEVTVPDDSSYVLEAVSLNGSVLSAGTDYTAVSRQEENKITYNITFLESDNVKIGQYSAVFTDNKYEDLSASFELKADMSADDVKLADNKLVILSDAVDTATYISAISSDSINGNAVRGATGASLFDENGNVLLNAEVTSKGNTTVLFPEAGEYVLEIKAIGYPGLKGTVTIGGGDQKLAEAVKTGDASPVGLLAFTGVCALGAAALAGRRREV